jgi:flagellar biosynthesis protein FlhF
MEPVSNAENEKITTMQLEIANMSRMLQQILYKDSTTSNMAPILKALINNDIDIQVAEQIVKNLPTTHQNDQFVSPELKELMMEQIKKKLQNIEGIEVPKMGRKIVAFIGSTGVGKTTTIAKIAANFAIHHGYSVALVTADTYRVSAVEQLKTYSDIMGIPIHVVYTADELKKVLDVNWDKQLILIDTAGRSPHNSDQLTELDKLLQVDDSIEKYLVLSTTTKYKDALDIVEKFAICSPNKVIFTKLDEARNIGTIINLLYKIPIPLSYITTGQNVPDDIELADPRKLTQLMFRDS